MTQKNTRKRDREYLSPSGLSYSRNLNSWSERIDPTSSVLRVSVAKNGSLPVLAAPAPPAMLALMSVRQIALQAGVNASTVSRALRNSPKIPEETRQRIQAIAKKIGYRPNAKIVSLMTQMRSSQVRGTEACFGVVSFYENPRPWEQMLHLTRIYQAMVERANELAYRLEPIWFRAPGMTHKRIRTILDTRGIQGLICFGSPLFEQDFPVEFDHYAIVTLGQSIRTRLHRVTSHFFSDTWRTLERLHAYGYRRPGLVLGHYEDKRSGQACSSAYFGWCEQRLGTEAALPILRLERIEEGPLMAWLEQQKPDVLVFIHRYDTLLDLRSLLRAKGLRIPKDLGVAVVSQVIDHTDFSGMQQNQKLMGSWVVEMLAARIMNLDLGIPAHARIEMVESDWVEGTTLRKNPNPNR